MGLGLGIKFGMYRSGYGDGKVSLGIGSFWDTILGDWTCFGSECEGWLGIGLK